MQTTSLISMQCGRYTVKTPNVTSKTLLAGSIVPRGTYNMQPRSLLIPSVRSQPEGSMSPLYGRCEGRGVPRGTIPPQITTDVHCHYPLPNQRLPVDWPRISQFFLRKLLPPNPMALPSLEARSKLFCEDSRYRGPGYCSHQSERWSGKNYHRHQSRGFPRLTRLQDIVGRLRSPIKRLQRRWFQP